MTETLKEIRDSIFRIINANIDYDRLYDQHKINFTANGPWYLRLHDVTTSESRITLTNLILALRLNEVLRFEVTDFDDKVRLLDIASSIDHFTQHWENAIIAYQSYDNVDRLLKQFISLSKEAVWALENLQIN